MDRGAWWATVHGVTKELDTTLQLNNNESHPLEYTEQPHPQTQCSQINKYKLKEKNTKH